MNTSPLDQAFEYHHQMPGIIRATLRDFGLDDETIDEHLIGWDGKHVTKPLLDIQGEVVDVERYELAACGKLGHLIKALR